MSKRIDYTNMITGTIVDVVCQGVRPITDHEYWKKMENTFLHWALCFRQSFHGASAIHCFLANGTGMPEQNVQALRALSCAQLCLGVLRELLES